MFPVLFQIDAFSFFGVEIGMISIFSHGVFQALGFLIAVSWFLKIAEKRHFHLEFILDHFFSLLFWSLLGSRLMYLFAFWDRYSDNLLSVFSLYDGGFLFWGGVLGFLLTLYYHCKKHQEKFDQWLDIIVPAGIIAIIFDTFGAFLGGEQYGTPTELPFGVAFENVQVPFTIPIHPVQLYLLFALLLSLLLLQFLHQKKYRPTTIGNIALALFSLSSFFTEYFRGDEMVFYAGHRLTQIVEFLVFLMALISLLFQNRRQTSS